MKKTLTALAISIGFVGIATASDNYMKEYDRYAESMGDSTPMDYESWKRFNGYAKETVSPKKALTEKEREYIAFANSYGDATPPSYATWANGDPVEYSPRKVLTKLEKEYIEFADSFGDATPPSFAQWKSELRYSDTQLAENAN